MAGRAIRVGSDDVLRDPTAAELVAANPALAGSGGGIAWTAAGQLVYGTGVGTSALLAAGAQTQMLVGGGAAAPVWTTATGTGAPVRADGATLTNPTITTPTFSAPIPATAGGTGQTAYTIGDLLYASSTTALSKLAAVALLGSGAKFLQSVAAGAAPIWSTYSFIGTPARTYTFPTTNATLARTDAGQTFAGTQTFADIVATTLSITASGGSVVLSPAGGGTVAIQPTGALTLGGATIVVTTSSTLSLSTTGAGATTVTSAAATNITTTGGGAMTISTVSGVMTIGPTGSGLLNISGGTGALGTLSKMTFVLDQTLSGDGKYCGTTQVVTAGETIVFGEVVYLKAADSRWYRTNANASATSGPVKIAIAVSSGAAAGAMTVLHYGTINAASKFPTLTVGAPAYVHTTAGEVSTAQPGLTDYVIRIVGHALTADELFFDPSNDYLTHT